MKLLTTLLMIGLLQAPAFAKRGFNNALLDAYPVVARSPHINNCMTCHTIDKWQRNDFGRDLQHWLRSNYGADVDSSIQYAKAFVTAGILAISHMDSDGDGYTNGEELELLTRPGDALEVPQD